MADLAHTWNTTCILSQSQSLSTQTHDEDSNYVPSATAQFFYTSSLPIDDPLSIVPIPTASVNASSLPPQPFSAHDNAALESAWRSFASAEAMATHRETNHVISRHSKAANSGHKNSKEETPSSKDTIAQDRTEEMVKTPPVSKTRQRRFLQAVAGQTGTTGTPFRRAPSYKRMTSIQPTTTRNRPSLNPQISELATTPTPQADDIQQVLTCKTHEQHMKEAEVEVLVGASRLHQVKLPSLQMLPIYWSPVHDEAAVIRGTWFYADTVLPVECVVANELEAGYRSLRPWSQTWADELASALEHGAVGEEKIVHKLWTASETTVPTIDPRCAARCFNSDMAANGLTSAEKKRYPNSSVIYKDAKHAFILKPNLTPSEYYGRRPLSKITKNIPVGIPVVRGFDRKAWNKLYPTKNAGLKAKVKVRNELDKNKQCPACHFEKSRPVVTDLVLVIHGIGQKLSERVESFHFTHAVNSFRRAVNIELASDEVRQVLRPDHGGMMVLPINWRAHLPAEAGGTSSKESSNDLDDSTATLEDITIKSIPAVRSLISDVLLDLPYYMSKHKPAMVKALITEANLVYNSWCLHNPGFHENGRVHIIAHSLGSVMAMEVLSNQPTIAPSFQPSTQIASTVEKQHFQFDTTNLFFAGSPAALFLHLDGSKLSPRGRRKPGADAIDNSTKHIIGKVGNYGCMAVNNLYNICHPDDPVSYLLNPLLDKTYSTSLAPATLPSLATWLTTLSTALHITPSSKPLPQRQPSNLEMEVHDFTREELAEKKFFALNDNGQIDYFLAGGGVFDVGYINMIGAHSSYWLSRDFVRAVVVECGRTAGREGALEDMRAIKAGSKR